LNIGNSALFIGSVIGKESKDKENPLVRVKKFINVSEKSYIYITFSRIIFSIIS